jgi:hypothetical protein
MLALLVAIATVSSFAYLSTEGGTWAALDWLIIRLENIGVAVDDARYTQLMSAIPAFRWTTAAAALVGLPLVALGASGAIYAVFRILGNRTARFVQVLAVFVHSAVVLSLQRLLALPLNYVNESLTTPTNLGAMLPMLEETSFLAAFLGGIDLFTVWWLIVLALGLAALYPPPARRIAASLLGGYVVVALTLALTITTLRIS